MRTLYYWHRVLHFSRHGDLPAKLALLALGVWFGYLFAEAVT